MKLPLDLIPSEFVCVDVCLDICLGTAELSGSYGEMQD